MKAILGVGSNIQPRENIASACQRLARDAVVSTLSRPWWTPAVGSNCPPFLNCVAIVETPLAPIAMRRWLRAIEHDHGRSRSADRNAARTLDIDVLALGTDLGAGNGWTFHVDVSTQPYHLLPLADVLPNLCLPDGRTVAEHAQTNPLPAATPLLEGGFVHRPGTASAVHVRTAVLEPA